jgi:signal transduction histidine kinase
MDGGLSITSQALRSSISSLDLLQGAPVGVLLIDRERHVLFANQWFVDRFKAPASSWSGRFLDSMFLPESRAEAAHALDTLFDTAQEVSWQGTFCWNGIEQVGEFVAAPVLEGKVVTAAELVCQGIEAYRQVQCLQALGSSLQSSLDLDTVYRSIVDSVVAGLGFDLALLAALDAKRDALVVCAGAVGAKRAEEGDFFENSGWKGIRLGLNEVENLIVRTSREGQVATSHSLQELFQPMVDVLLAHETQHAFGIRSLVNVPLMVHGQLVGSLTVGARQELVVHAQTALLGAFASQAAMAIENARLYDAVNQRLAEVSTLYMLANQVSSSLDLNVVLNSVMDILKKVLDCRGGCIFLLDERREWLEVRASSGIKPYWQREARMRLGEGISGQVALTAQPVYIPDTHLDPDFIVFDPAVRSLLVVPLIFKGEVIGTLNVDDDTPDAFSDDVSRLLSIVAVQAAAAIQSAKLYTDLKERAEKLAQAHKELQESDRVRSEFVQNVSHELRTPLTFVKGYVEVLLEGILGPLTEQQVNSLRIVADRTTTIINLVNDILSLQRIERGELQFAPVSMAEIAIKAIESARAAAQQARLALIEDFEPGLGLVWGDRARLEQVFNNLIGNALKFSPDPLGKITVRLRSHDKSVRVDVIDQGIGIPQDQLTKIFERFYQVDGSSTRRFGGTGLGLAIVKEIIDAHGGMILVESEPGVGSMFSFTVPLASEQSVPGREEEQDGDQEL